MRISIVSRLTAVAAALMLWVCTSTYALVIHKSLDVTVPDNQLPYRLEYLVFPPSSVEEALHLGDLNGDGSREYIVIYCRPAGFCSFSTAFLYFKDPYRTQLLSQYNGPYMSGRLWSTSLMDIEGTGCDKVVMTKTVFDTVLLEIVGFNKSLEESDTTVVVAAVGRNLGEGHTWQYLTVSPILSFDVNRDGHRDLLFGRSAKPDSAFERSIVAYDLYHHREIWAFSVSDFVSARALRPVCLPNGDTILVFSLLSSANRYVSHNGFDSRKAYLGAITLSGKELWRREVGGPFFHQALVVKDINDDGQKELLCSIQRGKAPDSSVVAVGLFDVETGELKSISPFYTSTCGELDVAESGGSDSALILASFVSDTISTLVRLDAQCRPLIECHGATAVSILDLGPRKRRLVLVDLPGRKPGILNPDLELLAYAEPEIQSRERLGQDTRDYCLMARSNDYMLIRVTERSLLTLIYARYKWWLAVALAMMIIGSVVLIGRWLRGLFLSAAGVPGLDKVDSLVIVLNRSGRILYTNHHPLAERLLGPQAETRRRFSLTALSRFPTVIEFLDRSFVELSTPMSERLEISPDGSPMKIVVTAYPRLDRNRKFDGKIVIAEDVSSRVDWQRKIVLGEAAQRWLHKLKGNLATSRIFLDNLREDERIRGAMSDPIVGQYLESVAQQLDLSSQTAGKILRFTSVGKPQRIPCDLNQLVIEALGPTALPQVRGVSVAKRLLPHLPLLMLDPSQMAEVLDNLLSNANRAVKGSGQITVSTRLASDLQPGQSREVVELLVADTGVGIAEEDMDRIFAPGYSKSGGTGVGLPLVKEIVESHGGNIEVNSEFGKGSTFIVRLPVDGCANGGQ